MLPKRRKVVNAGGSVLLRAFVWSLVFATLILVNNYTEKLYM